MRSTIKEIIFDVDGTLWDSTEKVALAWIGTCRKHGVPSDHITGERLKKEFGKLLKDIGLSLFSFLPEEEAIALTQEACDDELAYLLVDPPAVYEGVEELFRELQLRGIPVYIVSNAQMGYIETMLKVSGLGPYVSAHLCAGDTGLDKAGTIRTLVEREGLRSPVYVGDTQGDCDSAHKAGLPFIHAAYGFGKADCPEEVIESPLGLLDLL